MKKTLLLTHEYYPYKGGVARYCYNLFKFLDQQEYWVVTDHAAVFAQNNIIKLKLTNKFIRPVWLFSFFKLNKIIQQHQIKKIFTPNILPLGTMAYLINLLFKIPYIISLHGLDINLALKNKPELTNKILKNAEKIIVNSQYTAKVIAPLRLSADKICLLYPSIDLKTEYDRNKLEDLKKKFKIQTEDKILLTVGRLNRRKGQDLVIEAINKLKSNFSLKYFIVGQGSLKEELLKLIKKYKLTSQVFILEDIDDQDLVYYYQLADIFVLPNRTNKTDVEGFGIVFLEAARCGLPIIAGQGGGVEEILTDQQDALLVASDDLEQLIQNIQSLLNNPQKADKLAEQALVRAGDFPSASEQSLILKRILG